MIKNKDILAIIEKKKHEVRCENCKYCDSGAYNRGKWYCGKISVFKVDVDIEKCFESKGE